MQKQFSRFPTREVTIGNIKLGSSHPIRIQSMTASHTLDTESVLREIEQLVEAGCEMVRLTAPNLKEARHLEVIRNQLEQRSIHVPLIADIHYLPAAALHAADFVDKVRINPGNFVEPKKDPSPYSDDQYNDEIKRTGDAIFPLLEKMQTKNGAIRIGVNHGSLSRRILDRYGNSAEGMVVSALEYIDLFRKMQFHNLVVSLKSSHPSIMIEAYRKLIHRYIDLGYDYPLHLGVTEAGNKYDGTIRSALGIGLLLSEGIGDTIRVSLTEDSVEEIPVARKIIANTTQEMFYSPGAVPNTSPSNNSYFFTRKEVQNTTIPHGVPPYPLVILEDSKERFDLSAHFHPETRSETNGLLKPIINPKDQRDKKTIQRFVFENNHSVGELPPWDRIDALEMIEPGNSLFNNQTNPDDLFNEFSSLNPSLENGPGNIEKGLILSISHIQRIQKDPTAKQGLIQLKRLLAGTSPFVVALKNEDQSIADERFTFHWLRNLLKGSSPGSFLFLFQSNTSHKDFLYRHAILAGGLLLDGIIQGVILAHHQDHTQNVPFAPNSSHGENSGTAENLILDTLAVFQVAGSRKSKADYISCPSCGRTYFDIQQVSRRIRAKTEHLRGVKIGIMGCIVNGPGEMADADFGYVGSGPGLVDLYQGQDRVQRNLPEHEAELELINLIKRAGRWVDPPGSP